MKKLIYIIFALYILNLIGCAELPVKENIATYDIKGTTYMSLSGLCANKGIDMDYDTIARTVVLTKNAHKINMLVGDSLVLVDGSSEYLKSPVDIYQGMIVIPSSFKEQLDRIFKTCAVQRNIAVLSNIKRIVIDAGHGGNDPGAIGRTGLREKYVTLDLVERLSKIFESRGIEVVLTRSSDRFIPLQSRVDIANRSKSDIFLSIHANANRVRSLSGFEVYYIAPKTDNKRALADAEEANLNFNSSCFAERSLNLKAILWDMINNYNRALSIELANSICGQIRHNLDAEILGVKGAGYYVLKGVRMPAILVEVGFLSNGNEENMLKNGYYRQQLAQNIAAGILSCSQDAALTEACR